jgi:hypothetical protein
MALRSALVFLETLKVFTLEYAFDLLASRGGYSLDYVGRCCSSKLTAVGNRLLTHNVWTNVGSSYTYADVVENVSNRSHKRSCGIYNDVKCCMGEKEKPFLQSLE